MYLLTKLLVHYIDRGEEVVAVVISFKLCVSKKWCAKKFRDHVTLYVNEVQGI